MAASIGARVVAPPPNWVELPSLPHPQYLNENGCEVDAPEVEDPGIEGDATQEESGMEIEEEKPELDLDGGAMELDGDVGEPLLDISESLVFAQSLKQSRQRHMQRLFPLIFTHPPLPSYQKPRARGPPKSTFLYPTPAAPTAPLPYREYHGPRKADATDTPSPGTPKADDGKSTSAIRSQARAKRAAELDEVAPAHETECIARVTLTIGPFSYPETELWIGRFVEPRAEASKVAKAEKRARMDMEAPKKKVNPVPRPSMPPPPINRPTMAGRPPAQNPPSAPPARARPPPIPTTARPGPPPPRPGSFVLGSAAPKAVEGAINPELIKKVNLAAATRPWLSEIIHKAARKQASKDELARLGRAVGRLNRGENVDEGEAGAAPSTAPASAVPARMSADNETSRSSSSLSDDDDSGSESSDLEASMKGPKQVGGGPMPEVTTSSHPPSTAPRPTSPRIPSSSSHFQPSAVRPPSGPQRPPTYPTNSLGAAHPRPPPPSANPPFPPSSLSAFQSLPIMPPPPPRPEYAKQPPFLFLAFKDSPTEKFLIPLGANSFITRAGGDFVTHPRPAMMPPAVAIPSLPISTSGTAPPAPAAPAPVIPAGPPALASVAAKLRTRASLGRGSKTEAPVPKEEPKPKLPTPEPVEPVRISEPPPPRPVAPPPPPGTVTISTLMPTGAWDTPDWDQLEKGLPWVNSAPVGAAKSIPQPSTTTPVSHITPGTPIQPNLGGAQHPSFPVPTCTISPSIPVLNLGAVDFTPPEGDLQPATVHLAGLDDHAWSRMKQVMEIVEMTELGVLGREPGLLPTPNANAGVTNPAVGGQQLVRQTYLDRKKARFARLLARAPPRSFLRLRMEFVDPALIESLSDKWAPRPYSITTKSLYTRSPPPDDEGDRPPARRASPEKPAKKRKSNAHEPAVAFEMPVSLDALDEMVEEGAKFAIGRRGKAGRPTGSRKSGGDRPRKSKAADGAEGGDGQKKPGLVRGRTGAVCEGCASTSQKVWRKGPGGKGTLCKDCGDAYNAGTLGELKAPGAMSAMGAAPVIPAPIIQLGEKEENTPPSTLVGQQEEAASSAKPTAAALDPSLQSAIQINPLSSEIKREAAEPETGPPPTGVE